MKHILHHKLDPVARTVNIYLDVKKADFDLDPEQSAMLKQAVAAKMAMGLITRAFGGATAFVHPPQLTSADELQLMLAVLGTLARTQPAELKVGDRSWSKY